MLSRMINCHVCHHVSCGNAAGASSAGTCKEKDADCDTGLAGCHLFVWNQVKGLLNST